MQHKYEYHKLQEYQRFWMHHKYEYHKLQEYQRFWMQHKYEYHKLQEYQRFWMHHKYMYHKLQEYQGFWMHYKYEYQDIKELYRASKVPEVLCRYQQCKFKQSHGLQLYRTTSISWSALKGQCHRIFGVGFLFIKQPLMVPLCRGNLGQFRFCWIFTEIFKNEIDSPV